MFEVIYANDALEFVSLISGYLRQDYECTVHEDRPNRELSVLTFNALNPDLAIYINLICNNEEEYDQIYSVVLRLIQEDIEQEVICWNPNCFYYKEKKIYIKARPINSHQGEEKTCPTCGATGQMVSSKIKRI